MKEANIMIRGFYLSVAESMAIRVALSSYLMQMESEGLGDDEHGKTMSELYAKNCKSVLKAIHEDINRQ